jgi:hypothetical protein
MGHFEEQRSAGDQSPNGCVQVRADSLASLFEPFDPAPLAHRSIADSVEEYIVRAVRFSPPGEIVSVRILLPSSDSACCAGVQEAFRRHFADRAEDQRKALAKHFRDSFRTLGIAIVFALGIVMLSQGIAGLAPNSILVGKIATGLGIAGWVTLWRPMEMLAHDWRPMRRDLQLRERLAGMTVTCEAPERDGRD